MWANCVKSQKHFIKYIVNGSLSAKFGKQLLKPKVMGPTSTTQLQTEIKDHGNFVLTYSSKMEDFISVSKYQSKRTGITVCIGQVEGPTVNGHLCLATEAHDDDGLPHTLEHLIFLGSESYPYKGVLDLAANRCLASGTNAWTATDHTCYTVMTAGAEGFLKFLPLYLDHILYPTLSHSGFVTEVHHVNGDGEDAGVVYSEMQGVESLGESRAFRAMLHALYPGRCGYKYETGGILKNLRESTTNEKVRNYHKTFYRPENLCIVITGQVSAEQVFDALNPIEEKILEKGLLDDYQRPWKDSVPPLESSVSEVIEYPSDDEENGLVYVAWRGPKSSSLEELVAMDSLLLYLTDSAISPLRRKFVELDDPLCNKVSHSVVEYSEGFVQLSFENVPKSKLGLIEQKLFELLTNIELGSEPLDMQRMQSVIHRKLLSTLSGLESEPHDSVVQRLIQDFLHGTGIENLNERLNQVSTLKTLKEVDNVFWIDLIKKYFLHGHHVTIAAKPSVNYMKTTTAEEKRRIAEQQLVLGYEGLQQKAADLDSATEANEVLPPNEMIQSFVVPSIDGVHFHRIQHYSSHSATATNSRFSFAEMPFRFELDDMHTNFAMLHVVIDTSVVPQQMKLLMPLFLEVIFESAIVRDGVVVPHEIMVKELAEDTVYTAATLGLSSSHEHRFNCGQVAQVAHIYIEVEISKYEKGVRWLRELLFATKLTEERLKIVATKMGNDVPRLKRKGSFIASCLASELCYSRACNHRMNNLMWQNLFLKALLVKLSSDPSKVLECMEKLRGILTNPDNMTVFVATDVDKLANHVSDLSHAWIDQFSRRTGGGEPLAGCRVQACHELLVPFDRSPTLSAIVGVGSIESSFLVQFAPTITCATHEDFPAIRVLLQYLTQLEGPMWRQIRGLGLAYGYWSLVEPHRGLISLSVYRSTQLISAYRAAVSIMRGYSDGTEQYDEMLIESARSSLVFDIIQKQETVKLLSDQSLILHLNKLDFNFNKDLLKNISKVGMDDLKRVGQKYLPALLDPNKSWLTICCHPSRCEEISAGFKEFSRNLLTISLERNLMVKLEDCHLPWTG